MIKHVLHGHILAIKLFFLCETKYGIQRYSNYYTNIN